MRRPAGGPGVLGMAYTAARNAARAVPRSL